MTTSNGAAIDPKAADKAEDKKFDASKLRKFGPLIGFIVIVVFFAIATGGSILTLNNIKLILSGGYMLMISACGVWLVMTMGCLDFSQGSMLGVCCAVFCYLSSYNFILAVLASIATGALIGAVNAYFHVNRQIQSFVVTQCTMYLLRGVVSYITTTNPVYAATYVTSLNTVPILMGLTVVVLVVTYLVTHFTSLEHNLKAIGANETAARFAGIRVNRTKFLVYVVAGCITGLAAVVNAIKIGSVTSKSGNMFETQLLVAMVLGGMPINGGANARFSNIVLGVLSYLFLEKGLVMMGFSTEIQQLILGIVFLIMVTIFSERTTNQVIK